MARWNSPPGKTARYYLELPYTREAVREDDGTWFARVLELPGCMTVGETRQEALDMLDDAMTTWLRVRLGNHETIPSPSSTMRPSS